MKRWFILIVFTALVYEGATQSADKGRVKFYIGEGLSVMSTSSNERLNGGGKAFATATSLGIRYHTHDRVSIGFDLAAHRYLEDDSTINQITGGATGLSFQYYFWNKEKANAFIGVSFGFFGLNSDAIWYPDTSAVDQTPKPLLISASGVYQTLHVGLNKYFGQVFGLFIKGGFTNNPAQLDYGTLDGEDLETYHNVPVSQWRLLMRGGFLSAGVSLKFRNGKKEKEIK